MDEATQSRLLERIAEHLAADGATTTDAAGKCRSAAQRRGVAMAAETFTESPS